MSSNLILIHDRDNVAVALRDIKKQETLNLPGGKVLVALTDIPCGHKVALVDLPVAAEIVKYGEVIGRALMPILCGEWIHTHNLI